MISIVIPTFNNLDYLKLCIQSIKKNSRFNHEIKLHVNDGSDGTLEYASNMSTITKSLYEAQFDHWRCRIYAPSKLSDQASEVARRELGI